MESAKGVESKYKTKDESEREDNVQHRKHKAMTFMRRQAKIDAEGFKCPYEGCVESFPTSNEINLHVKAHKVECWSQMKCSQPKCGQKV